MVCQRMFDTRECVGALCTVLIFFCTGQIIATAVLSFVFPHFLALAHCNVATGAGVVSGFVVIPMVVQLKLSQISVHVDRKYGYTIWYQRLAIGVCFLLHLAALIIALYSVLVPRHRNEDFLEHMKKYTFRRTSKSLVDNIQWALQCCGAQSYEDWFKLAWTKQASKNDLGMATAVPFSCCIRKILDVCYHYDIKSYGAATINSVGCGGKVRKTAQTILWVEIFVYSVCMFHELAIVLFLHRRDDIYEEPDGENSLHNYLHYARSKNWTKIGNEKDVSHSNKVRRKLFDS